MFEVLLAYISGLIFVGWVLLFGCCCPLWILTKCSDSGFSDSECFWGSQLTPRNGGKLSSLPSVATEGSLVKYFCS